MKGLVIWAQSVCRSQMGVYAALGKAFGCPIVAPVSYYRTDSAAYDNRDAIGFSSNEFPEVEVIPVGEDGAKGLAVLDAHPGWNHLFCVYQASPNFRALLLEAKRRGERVAIGSESPCNMDRGWRGLAKDLYLQFKLPQVVREVIAAADFMVNYSGDDKCAAHRIGWPNEKIIPFGYFPPPIPGTVCVQRKTHRPFTVLATGTVSWHRGSDILLKALAILKKKGVDFRAVITQEGPLLDELKSFAARRILPVDFVGFLPLEELHKAYETCSVYVGAGRREPWGMRLNDALNCGAPLIVSRGMGGVKMIDDYGCGLAFENENPKDLANQLQRMATDAQLYLKCAERAIVASEACQPDRQANNLVYMIRERFPSWMK